MYPFNILNIHTSTSLSSVYLHAQRIHSISTIRSAEKPTIHQRASHFPSRFHYKAYFARWFILPPTPGGYSAPLPSSASYRHHRICSTAIYKVKTPTTKCSFILLISRCLGENGFLNKRNSNTPVYNRKVANSKVYLLPVVKSAIFLIELVFGPNTFYSEPVYAYCRKGITIFRVQRCEALNIFQNHFGIPTKEEHNK